MKIKSLLAVFCVLSLGATAAAFVDLETRAVVEVEDGLLTPFWAQEYIGADLVKEEMRGQSDLQRVPFAIYDLGFERNVVNLTLDISVDKAMNGHRQVLGHHGSSVAALVNGPGMMSVSEVVDYVQLKRVSPAAFYSSAVGEIKKLQRKPLIISNSMGWSSPAVLDLAKEVDQMGIIWVMASGNEFPEKIVEHERVAPVISVGSYSPRGLQSLSSQESDQLDILAPADEYQASIDGKGESTLFGATSGATPLVSGSIANIKALIPSLTRGQIEKLLKRTALRSFHSYYLLENKAGLLNAYRLFKVVERLRGLCGQNQQCLATELDNRQNYIFAPAGLSRKALTVCDSQDALDRNDMMKLRRNFLLNVEQTDYAKLLSCAYRNEGFAINADYYENMALIYESPQRLQKKIQQQAVEAVKNDFSASASLRDLQILDQTFREALIRVIQGEGGMEESQAQDLLESFDKKSLIQIPKK